LSARWQKTVVSYNAATFYDRDGTLQGVFAAARDVTERKSFEQALQETNVEMDSAQSAAEKTNLAKFDFLSGMSHSSGGSDFNTYGTVGYTLEQKRVVLLGALV
jgi:hypothetical protein